MKKGKIRSEVSLQPNKSDLQEKEEIFVPLDVLTVKINSLRIPDCNEPGKYAIKVTFFDQIILTGLIKSVGGRNVVKKKVIARGIMSYDPSDYERMCLIADHPLVVTIQAMRSTEPYISGDQISTDDESDSLNKRMPNISCCNIDILTLFIGQDKLKITKRMEPIVPPSILMSKSWNNLPQITMELSVLRHKANSVHHEFLQQANLMKITLIGAYNMFVPFEEESIYTSASKLPTNMTEESNTAIITFDQGYKVPKRFDSSSFYPKWETLRGNQFFTKCDEKFECQVEELINDYNIDLHHYLKDVPKCFTTLWASFHRSLVLKNSETWLKQHLRRYNWPFEVQVCNEFGGYNFMAFLDLFKLLYPGENVVRLITPLQWINSEFMMSKCGCDLILAPNDKMSSAQGTIKKPSKVTTDSAPTSNSTDLGFLARPTGGDETNSFIIVEVRLARPLHKPAIPPYISMSEITAMLKKMEEQQIKRECTGRGQLNRDWQSTVKSAANSLRRIPYYGMTDICAINRQLSETRNRVEMITSFWQDAAIFINNNFVPQEFLGNNDLYEEMLMMGHACLMRTANDALVGVENQREIEPLLRAARHARQLKDIHHAVDLFLQLISEKPRDANIWRELSTCLKDTDLDWANVCINKSLSVNIRHPLTLLSKACMVFDDDPDAAEPFFVALLSLYPFWVPMWIAVNAYYLHRQMFDMAQEIMECIVKTSADGLEEENMFPRTWEQELGDWWDHTPLLPGTSLYYEAADLLLRIRAISLAEICIGRALCQSGETAAHYHLVALCCRLRKDPADALCHLQLGIAKFGDISYLRSLEAECHHKLKNIPESVACFEKAGTCSSAYSVLLSLSRRESKRMRSLLIDLIRRQPNAYAWMALADDWMMRSASGESNPGKSDEDSSCLTFATACAVQALKWDRNAGRAWALLAKLVKPNARRQYCRTMAIARSASGESNPGKSDEDSSCLTFATACAVQALKWDRNAGRAWALLAKLVKPNARRQYCRTMAIACGYNKWSEVRIPEKVDSQQSICHRLGTAMRECRCEMCAHLTF